MTRELFVFWQFNGDNRCYCQLHCPECYGRDTRTFLHYWNGKIDEWKKAFERLHRDIYFVFSYGEAMVSKGFYECVDMIGEHPNWTLNIITNFMADPTRLLNTRLANDKRLFLTTCWHPEGVDDPIKDWELFKQHLLMAKNADVPIHVAMVWFPFVIKRFPEYFEWLDKHDFRVGVRRFVYDRYPLLQKITRRVFPKWLAGKLTLEDYTEAERGYIYAYTCPKVTKYGLDLASTYGVLCSAGKDMILVEHDGTVKLCACCDGPNHKLGNIFDEDYKLNTELVKCPAHTCGGDFGMLHLVDDEFGPLPDRLWKDTFISQVENIKQGSPIAYHRREEMLKWIEELKKERSQS